MNNTACILIVDDNQSSVKALELVLQRQGFSILTAFDGYDALKQVAAHKPDLILLDVVMPGIDGFEVCRRLRAHPETASIPVIFLTIKGRLDLPEVPELEKVIVRNVHDRNEAFDLGASGFLSKPISAKMIVEEVNRVLTLAQLGDKKGSDTAD